MTASPLTVHVTLQRRCPACAEVRCADPAECLFLLTSRPWDECGWCAGSGWASESAPLYNPLSVFCAGCYGSGLEEHSAGSVAPGEISDNAKARLAAYVDALRARLEVSAPAVLDPPTTCPGCRVHAPGWVRVPFNGFSVLTHDGDLICPADPTFGSFTRPEVAPAPLAVVV
jgi:hypothetical protein